MSIYVAVTDDCTPSTYSCEGRIVRKQYENSDFYLDLYFPQDESHVVILYKNNNGLGRIELPTHVVYNLPEMLAILGIENPRIFGSTQIFKNQPVVTLFPPIKGSEKC